MMMGFFHPGTSRGMLEMTIGSRKITPPRMFLMVPLGERYMRLRPNSSTRASSGVIVAHFTPTPYCLIALAASTVTWSSVASRDSMPRSKYFSSTSRYGRISWSLMNCQMIRVISSPSSSTTGLSTLIFAMRTPASTYLDVKISVGSDEAKGPNGVPLLRQLGDRPVDALPREGVQLQTFDWLPATPDGTAGQRRDETFGDAVRAGRRQRHGGPVTLRSARHPGVHVIDGGVRRAGRRGGAAGLDDRRTPLCHGGDEV